MSVERSPGSISGLPDDELGTVAIALVVSEVKWTPDVAPAVLDRISRDAVTYPDHFDRRPLPPTLPSETPVSGRSARRTVYRLAVFGVLLLIVALAVVVAADAGRASAASPSGDIARGTGASGASIDAALAASPDIADVLPRSLLEAKELAQMDGSLVSFGIVDAATVEPLDRDGRAATGGVVPVS